ncbi:MAG: MATE family efflux transporter, partial [Clostridia bacterium]|nr:MATE family efflux transporter [Clostridia bacterium]
MANAAKTVGRRSSMDMTEGNIIKLIIVFALPILAGQIFQNLYNSVDAIVVGRYVGTTALAAVSASSDISHLLVGFFTGLSTGCGVLLSRYFGAKNYERLHDAIHTALCFALIVGFCMAALGIVATPLLLRIVDCPADVYAEASSYLRIYLAGILFTAIYNVGSG